MMEITHFKILADNLEVDLRIEDLRQSGGLSRDASTSEGWGLSGSRAQRSRLMLPSNFDSRTSPSSTLFSDLGNLEAARAEHGRANGRPWPPTGRFTEELDDGDGNSDDDSISSSQEEARLERNARFRADAQEAAETSALFGNLPFVPDEEDPWRIWSSNDETGRRRNHREAIVIGHADDGIEVIQQPDSPVPGEVPRMRGGEGDELLDGNEAQAADELIQQVRGLEGQVQGLLDTLHQFEEENGEEN